ncbi:hypothetical protein Q4493_09195 [Colwellia sp. 1_MG-2023]|uniref:hypothetical protein n=1 Tax=Colwellia sp. 1_MG-2023 TaxID=3062649 RepID=UPI0026E3CAF3|nr:hypothetical protein [Colwellia sp. 1_MG-2023]MDO6445946.1 hypothetical protein [Colwellia sp. 1_MG-2023]
MKRKYLVTFILIAGTLIGCSANDYGKMSRGSGISEALLVENCKDIICRYDNLKDRIQVIANDMSVFLSFSDSETRTIQYTWISGSNQISIDVFLTTLYGNWSYVEYAEVFIDKNMVAKVSGRADQVLGYFDDSVNEHEKIETLTGVIDIDTAFTIAKANYEKVTIRFYGKSGFTDLELPREHKLMKLVNLAKSSNKL